MTSETRAGLRDDEAAPAPPVPAGEPTGATGPAVDPTAADDAAEDGDARRGRLSLPLVPTLSVLLLLLLGAIAVLWSTRPGESAVRTGDYAEALQAARSGVVDLTSFDYLTLDDSSRRSPVATRRICSMSSSRVR